MILSDMLIRETLEKLSSHYYMFFNNQFIKYYLLDAKISKSIWLDVEDLMNSAKDFDVRGCELEKFYEQILSFVTFISVIQNEVLPRMLNEAQPRIQKLSSTNRVLYRMTLENLPENICIFMGMINELLTIVKRIDISMNGEGHALCIKLSCIKDIDEKLNGKVI